MVGIVPPLGLIGLKQLKLPTNHLKFWWGGPSLAKIVLNATSEGFFNLDNLDSQTDAQYSQKKATIWTRDLFLCNYYACFNPFLTINEVTDNVLEALAIPVNQC